MFKESVENFSKIGAKVEYIDFPDFDYGVPIWSAINM